MPHPQGAGEHARVRDTLLGQLRQLGLTPHLQTTPVVGTQSYRPYRAGTVHNIWARIPGHYPTGTLLLAAHYDSVNTGTGASDDGASVAALLETLRALQSKSKSLPNARANAPSPAANFNFRNDIIVLLTDGEETGLLGAKAFVEAGKELGKETEADSSSPTPNAQHPTPTLVLNFEARGTSGPSLMFETSEGNGWLARQFADAAPQPLGSSLFYAVYKLLPNDTDFTEFRRAGMIGLNFAYLDRVARYHTSLDDIKHLDLRSLQHHGDNMLSLARCFGNESLAQARQPDVIYFNVTRTWLCVYPQAWAMPLALLATILAVIVLVQRWLKSALPVWHRGVEILSGIVWVGLAGVAAVLALAILTYWLTSGSPSPRMTLYLDGTTLTGVLLLCVGGVLLILDANPFRLKNRTQPGNTEDAEADAQRDNSKAEWNNKGETETGAENSFASLALSLTFDAMQMGAIFWWLVLAWLTAIYLPDGSYLFLWPLLGVLAARCTQGAWLASQRQMQSGEESVSGFLLLCQMLGAIPAILLILPVLCLLFQTLSIGSFTIIGALTALTVALLRPQFQLARNIFPGHPQALPILLALAGMVLLWVGAEVLQPSEAHPLSNSLFYALDADTGAAVWASNDAKPDTWTKQFLGDHPERSRLPDFLPVSGETFLNAPAPLSPLPPPTALLESDRVENGVRELRLRLTSPRHAPLLEIAVAPDVRVLNASVEGKTVDGSRDPNHAWSLLYFDVPESGLTLVLRVSPAAPVPLRVIDRSYGLPAIPDKTYPPRPANMIASPASGWYQDTVLVARTFRF